MMDLSPHQVVSHHHNYCIFSRGSRTKPCYGWGVALSCHVFRKLEVSTCLQFRPCLSTIGQEKISTGHPPYNPLKLNGLIVFQKISFFQMFMFSFHDLGLFFPDSKLTPALPVNGIMPLRITSHRAKQLISES